MDNTECPECGGMNFFPVEPSEDGVWYCVCEDCGYDEEVSEEDL